MRKRERLLLHELAQQLDGAFGLVKVAFVAGIAMQAQQRHDRRAVSRGRRSIEGAFEPGDELLVIVGGKEKAAALLIDETLEDDVGQRFRVGEIARIE